MFPSIAVTFGLRKHHKETPVTNQNSLLGGANMLARKSHILTEKIVGVIILIIAAILFLSALVWMWKSGSKHLLSFFPPFLVRKSSIPIQAIIILIFFILIIVMMFLLIWPWISRMIAYA